MCGIVGVHYFDGRPVNRTILEQATGVLAHRGPDGYGVYNSSGIGLGHRLLAINDLSPAARQPILSEDRRFALILAGEIYNYRDLQGELLNRGHRLQSDSDAEVALHWYEEEGPAMLNRLLGMFALALWDESEKKLFLARDRLGEQPLKYYLGSQGIFFASELKALFAFPEAPREADLPALYDYLSCQYVPGPATGFKGVKKLPPAHFLTIRQGAVKIERYWTPAGRMLTESGPETLARRLRAETEAAVRLQLSSSVPQGVFLSGGIDSSVVAGLAHRFSPSPLPAFSAFFGDAEHNELAYARQAAETFSLSHTEVRLNPAVAEILPSLVYRYEEPYADSSAIASFLLAQTAARTIKVALGGDGGDENFAGYERYLLFKAYPFFPSFASLFAPGIACLPQGRFNRAAHVFLESLGKTPAARYQDWFAYSFFREEEKRRILHDDFLSAVGTRDSEAVFALWFASGRPPLAAALDFDRECYLPDDLTFKMNMAGLAHGLEVRSPLLDHRLVELAYALPLKLKLRGLTAKYIFKLAFKDLLPPKILKRGKQGFTVPMARWLREDLRPLAEDLLFSSRHRGRGLFKPQEVSRLLSAHVSGREDHSHRLYALLTLELWFRSFLDGQG